MPLKMSDIANLAHVSKATVSLVLNDRPGVSDTTRKRVQAIIAQHHYRPLRQSRHTLTHQLGPVLLLAVTTPGVVREQFQSLPFFNNLIYALTQEINRMNGTLKTLTVDGKHLTTQLTHRQFADQKVLVLGTDLTHDQVSFIQEQIQHVVFLDTSYDDISADFVTMDNYQGARLAGRYMVDRGYRRIGYFASNRPMSNFNERRRGFKSVLTEAGIQILDRDFYFISPIETDPQGLNLKTLTDRNFPPAVFCEDDYIALRLIKAAQQAEITIPDQLAIMGFDDLFAGTLSEPSLTSIHVSIDQIAVQALHQLANQFVHPDWLPQKTLVTTTLITRDSL